MNSYKILVVDDVAQQLKAIYAIIEKHYPEYVIYQANSGESAMALLNDFNPHIIISDWDMPGMSGIELLEQIKQNPETQNIPVIIITGVMTGPADLRKAIEAGAMDYLRKPLDELELLARMHAAIKMSEKHKELIHEKDNKIAEHIMFANEVNHFLKNILNNIHDFCKKAPDSDSLHKKTNKLISDIENRIKGTGWQKYSGAFNDLHPEFTRKILKLHPDLTPTELELCKMARLGLSIKELAALMFVTPESMRVSRSRLRKKLGLESEQNLQSYLSAI